MFDGPEPELLAQLDSFLAEIDPGVLVTWNGGRFDLPYLVDRSRIVDAALNLKTQPDHRTRTRRDPLPGHLGGYLGTWHGHRHLDAYQVYRADVGASLGLPCGLKPLARLLGLEPIEVDGSAIHELSRSELHDYVASDAVVARELAMRRWPTAVRSLDSEEFA